MSKKLLLFFLTLALGVCVAGHLFDKPPEVGKMVFIEGAYYAMITESDATARNTISIVLRNSHLSAGLI